MNMQGFLGSEFLDLGVAMALLFLFVSLICTALREVIEGVLKYRAENLHHALQEILSDNRFDGLVRQIYAHPSVYALYFGSYARSKTGLWWSNLPSYIPAANFSSALLDIIVRGDPDPPNPAAPPPNPAAPAHTAITVADVQAALANLDNPKLKRALLVAFDFAKDDLPTARTNLEAWYNAAMDRVSGAYKRQTQLILFVVGLVAAMLLNIDAITIVERLSQNKALRDAVVSAAAPAQNLTGAVAKPLVSTGGSAPAGAGTTPPAPPGPATPLARAPAGPAGAALALRANMESVGLPVGWDEWFQPSPPAKPVQAGAPVKSAPRAASPGWRQAGWFPTPQSRVVQCASLPKGQADCAHEPGAYYYLSPYGAILMGLGWLITAFAITLGAPFWFDVLNKFMVVRSTVKPSEKSGDEGSKDPQPGKLNPPPAPAPLAQPPPPPPAAKNPGG